MISFVSHPAGPFLVACPVTEGEFLPSAGVLLVAVFARTPKTITIGEPAAGVLPTVKS
jgi:hypothetical protein